MLTLFRLAGVAGTLFLGAFLAGLGGALQIAAFENGMPIVSGLGIAGMLFLLVAWLARRIARGPTQSDEPRQDG